MLNQLGKKNFAWYSHADQSHIQYIVYIYISIYLYLYIYIYLCEHKKKYLIISKLKTICYIFLMVKISHDKKSHVFYHDENLAINFNF